VGLRLLARGAKDVHAGGPDTPLLVWAVGTALRAAGLPLDTFTLHVMILVAAVIGAEKLWTRGPLLARVTGAASIGLGAFFLLRAAPIWANI